MPESACNKADSLYKYIQSIYSVKSGKFKEESEKDPGESGIPIFQVSRWNTKDLKVPKCFSNQWNKQH